MHSTDLSVDCDRQTTSAKRANAAKRCGSALVTVSFFFGLVMLVVNRLDAVFLPLAASVNLGWAVEEASKLFQPPRPDDRQILRHVCAIAFYVFISGASLAWFLH